MCIRDRAATAHGIKSLICLPDNAPISKVEATKSYGADVCLVEGVYDDAYNKALQLKDEKGYTFIHPFDDEDVIAGQGTIGLELLEQLPKVEAVIIPIGGGGPVSYTHLDVYKRQLSIPMLRSFVRFPWLFPLINNSAEG